MKTPTWAIVIGICLMLFGTCSVTNDVKSIYTPSLLEMQKDMMNIAVDERQLESKDSLAITVSDSIKTQSNQEVIRATKGIHQMLELSEFSKTWIVRFGYIGLLVSLTYILSGLFLIVKKKFSIKLVYVALICSIIFTIVQIIVLVSGSSNSLLALSLGTENIFGIIIDIIILVIFASMDKSFYKRAPTEFA